MARESVAIISDMIFSLEKRFTSSLAVSFGVDKKSGFTNFVSVNKAQRVMNKARTRSLESRDFRWGIGIEIGIFVISKEPRNLS
jgi:hypothetical protein